VDSEKLMFATETCFLSNAIRTLGAKLKNNNAVHIPKYQPL
jgi:hypothetical protein